MSFKYAAYEVANGHYVLPRVGKMRTEAHVWMSPALYEASEENMWGQLANAASYEGVTAVHLLPDGHSGFGVPVGSVVVTEDTLIQAASGYDISCGILVLRVPEVTAEKVQGRYIRERLISEIEKRVGTGLGSARPKLMPSYTQKKVDEVLHFGAKALGVNTDLCERAYIPVPSNIDLRKIEKAYIKALPQLGSLGSGNHFCEVLLDESGVLWVMIHTGSRGYGWQTANHYFYEGAKARGLPSNRREDSWLSISEPLGKEYWAYHNSAANYAIANRHAIALAVQEALGVVFGTQGEVYYEISHNLIQEETLVLPDGTTKKGFVHRKGSTRAFPAGHPDLMGTRWEKTGHPCLIPGSMYHGASILFPQKGAHQSACSVNHGSGRILARGEAKRKLGGQQAKLDDEMRNVKRTFNGVQVEGITTNTKHVVVDECSRVYKDLDSVLEVLRDTGIAQLAHRLWPVANIKGAD